MNIAYVMIFWCLGKMLMKCYKVSLCVWETSITYFENEASKCFLFKPEVAFLGHKVSAEGVSCDPVLVECVYSTLNKLNA